jgi:hypothetical protein
VAVALKHVFDHIKRITEEEAKEIQNTHIEFNQKFQVIEQKVCIASCRQVK